MILANKNHSRQNSIISQNKLTPKNHKRSSSKQNPKIEHDFSIEEVGLQIVQRNSSCKDFRRGNQRYGSMDSEPKVDDDQVSLLNSQTAHFGKMLKLELPSDNLTTQMQSNLNDSKT